MTQSSPIFARRAPLGSRTPGRTAALQVLGLLSLLLSLPTETMPFVLEFSAASPEAQPGLTLLLCSQLLAGFALLLRSEHWATAWVLLTMLLGGMWQFMGHTNGYPADDMTIPGYWLFPIVVVALRSASRRHYWIFAGVASLACLVQMNIQLNVNPRADEYWEVFADQIWVLQPVAQAVLFGDAVLAISMAHDLAVARSTEARREQERSQAESHAKREAARMLHDHVLHALQTVAKARTAPSRIVESCREAYEVMTTTGVGSSTRIESLIAEDPALAVVGAELRGTTHPLPAPVAQAIAATVHEVLTNVAKHAKAKHTRVEVETDGETVLVEVIDDGQGFDMSRRPVDRMGVGSSILQRMYDIGGDAQIDSAPGQGTAVRLQWPAPPAVGPRNTWRQAPTALLRRHLSRTAWPGLVTGVLMTLLIAPQIANSSLLTTAVLTAMLLGAYAAYVLRTRPLSTALTLILVGAAVAIWVDNLLSMSPVLDQLDYMLWTAWAGSALIHLVVLSTSRRTAILVTICWTATLAVGLAWRYGDWLAVWEHSFLLMAGAGDVFITLTVAIVAQTTVEQEAEAARVANVIRQSLGRAQALTQLQDHWSDRVLDEALPLLQGIADRRLSVASPYVRRRAAQIESSLRDEMVLGGRRTRLLDTLAHARVDGWRLTSLLDSNTGRSELDDALALVAALGRPRQSGQQVTVSAGRGAARVVVLETTEEQVEGWRKALAELPAVIDVDDDFVRLEISRSAESPDD